MIMMLCYLFCFVHAEMYSNDDGTIPATFNILYMIGWKPDPTQVGKIIICDVIKQNELELANIDFYIELIIAFNFLCILSFWASLKWLYLWNRLLNFYVIFNMIFSSRNVAYSTILQFEFDLIFFSKFRLILLDRITYSLWNKLNKTG